MGEREREEPGLGGGNSIGGRLGSMSVAFDFECVPLSL